ncbi:hypothetical protein ZIOFF_019105 [Zingiber officinale]|uniref:Uncharacterized protein n=1 Tax=Zingiber officinale TaxID=94328 RepID=A0A8J5LJ33_ZINOF|nr:hypothetical protein ZIOFF_019105 [Zingiber officinale]
MPSFAQRGLATNSAIVCLPTRLHWPGVSYIPLPKKRSPSDAPFTLVLLSESEACLKEVLGDDNAPWDMVTAKDLWDDKHFDGKDDVDQDDYVLVK